MSDIAGFFAHQEAYFTRLAQQGKSAHTLSAYRRDLAELAALMPSENGVLHPHHFTAALKKLSQRNRHPRSLARKLSAWRQYARYLQEQNLIDTDPLAGLRAPKTPERLPKAVDAEPLNRTFDHAAADTLPDCRDLAIFELLYGCGLRLAEVHGLNVDDIHLDGGWVSVTGKGGKPRQVPLGSQSRAALHRYLPRRHAPSGEQALFTNNRGRRLGMRQIQNRLRDWALKNGSPQHLSPHMLRHSYASHLLQSAGDIRAVQELLGHSRLSTTQIYTKLDFDHLAAAYDAAHPRAQRQNSSPDTDEQAGR
ncbi:tyrosine-type recombinase/integrase [Neisseria leonii]|uniref:tyrosine-type recombinase/integrase n=1 Tax=Neisseria leonii TaxID=2995413 RepID=UPI00237B3A80|nr:tyrosine-type recombinase/integrase [Neisseria sp. 3986]MDD9326561.1 tyrosine-type recombinase/integrase [Neisseria sp. 3986]